jgi:SAM-dependent methyltransferase
MVLERLDPADRATWAMYYADHVARYLFAAEHVRGKRVLDVGTGPGYGAVLLKAAGASAVTAIDLSAATVDQARARYGETGVTYAVGDAEALDAHGPVDVVCSFENIEHLTHPDKFVASAARALAPGGVLFCSSPDRRATRPFVDGKPANPFHTHEWFADEFRTLLAAGFEDVDVRAQVRGFGHAAREEAAAGVAVALDVYAALARRSLVGWLHRLFGRGHWLDSARAAGTAALRLGAGSPADYPVVAPLLVGITGEPFCHLAVCARPRPAGAR